MWYSVRQWSDQSGNWLSPSAGKNVVHQLSVTLEDLYNGITKKLALQKNIICEKCEGKN